MIHGCSIRSSAFLQQKSLGTTIIDKLNQCFVLTEENTYFNLHLNKKCLNRQVIWLERIVKLLICAQCLFRPQVEMGSTWI